MCAGGGEGGGVCVFVAVDGFSSSFSYLSAGGMGVGGERGRHILILYTQSVCMCQLLYRSLFACLAARFLASWLQTRLTSSNVDFVVIGVLT